MSYFTAIIAAIAMIVMAGNVSAEDTAVPAVSDTSALAVSDTTALAVSDTSALAASDTTALAVSDTSTQTVSDTSTQAVRVRNTAYDPARVDSAGTFRPSSRAAGDMFRGDGADPGEMLRYRALTSVWVPHTLSGSMNRLLHYGSPIPAEHSPFMRTDLFYHPCPGWLTGPEMLIFWENGPFRQTSLNLRLSRPLGANLMVSLFSNYRYLEGQRFNHERNDIVNFYNFFNSDTATIMNHGYNPLTDERMMGGLLRRRNADSSEISAAFSFVNLQNEYALNIPVESSDRLEWAQRDQRLWRLDAALTDKKLSRRWRADLWTAFVNEADSSSYLRDTSVANWGTGSNNFLVDADFTMTNNFGLTTGGVFRKLEHWNGEESFRSRYKAGAFYTHRFRPIANMVNTRLHLRFEMQFKSFTDTVYRDHAAFPGNSQQEPDIVNGFLGLYNGGGALEFMSNDSNARLRLYTGSGDTARYDAGSRFPAWFDHNGRIRGAEGEMRLGYLGLLIGYQNFIISDSASRVFHRGAWPSYSLPYPQPSHTFVIAPWMSRYQGFSLLTKAMITDTKPHLKASANLSYLIQPRGMAYNFEPQIGFDYWSEREPVLFAGHGDWHQPIYDLNLKITAHIKEFRLFYKIDNLLNLRQAYVPGYFSPGLTFRWGLNWYLQ